MQKKALGLLNGLMAKGYPPAEAEMGLLYETGNGVTKDLGNALSHYVKAAEAGDVNGEIELSLAYHQGIGVKADDSKSREWSQKVTSHKFECAASYLRALPPIISTYFQPPNHEHDQAGTIGIKFIFKDGRATDISLLKSSGNSDVDAAWLKATKDAKLPPWPENYRADNKTETFWIRGSTDE